MSDERKRVACHTYCRSDQNKNPGQGWDSVNLDAVTLAQVL